MTPKTVALALLLVWGSGCADPPPGEDDDGTPPDDEDEEQPRWLNVTFPLTVSMVGTPTGQAPTDLNRNCVDISDVKAAGLVQLDVVATRTGGTSSANEWRLRQLFVPGPDENETIGGDRMEYSETYANGAPRPTLRFNVLPVDTASVTVTAEFDLNVSLLLRAPALVDKMRDEGSCWDEI